LFQFVHNCVQNTKFIRAIDFIYLFDFLCFFVRPHNFYSVGPKFWKVKFYCFFGTHGAVACLRKFSHIWQSAAGSDLHLHLFSAQLYLKYFLSVRARDSRVTQSITGLSIHHLNHSSWNPYSLTRRIASYVDWLLTTSSGHLHKAWAHVTAWAWALQQKQLTSSPRHEHVFGCRKLSRNGDACVKCVMRKREMCKCVQSQFSLCKLRKLW